VRLEKIDMKVVESVKKVSLVAVSCVVFSVAFFAQEPTPTPTPQKRERVSKNETTTNPKVEANPTETPAEVKPTPEETNQSLVTNVAPNENKTVPPVATTEEEDIQSTVTNIYTNYLTEYRLAPEDVISVEVFGQPNYSKAGIVVPPTSKISYQLIPGGVFVGGKTTDQVAAEIAKKLDEYIIDPQVTVTLDKAVSAQFAVLGKVNAPGIRTMTRRYTVYEAIVESGSYAPGADKKRITLLRRTPQGSYTPTILKIDEMVAGKVPMEYLIPGDQIVVPEKKWSMTKILDVVGKVSAFRILFGSPF
jgi:polysaccharide biosynthesis/export protein